LDAVLDAQLGEEGGDVALHGGLGEAEVEGYRGVGLAVGEQGQHLAFAAGELVVLAQA
jgi:hypothetical protein